LTRSVNLRFTYLLISALVPKCLGPEVSRNCINGVDQQSLTTYSFTLSKLFQSV